MRWYEGSITEAITISKSKGAVFVVYIEGKMMLLEPRLIFKNDENIAIVSGKDDKSSHITNLINTELISGKLESNAFVAVKLEADSLPHQQFSQICILYLLNTIIVYFKRLLTHQLLTILLL